MPAKKPKKANPPKQPGGSPVDAYLAKVPAARRPLLATLRRRILAAAPGAEECISYGLAAFRVRGKVVAGFQATAKGGSFYPFSGTTLETLADALEGWSRTKSALHFTADRPIPPALLKKLLAARLAELDA